MIVSMPTAVDKSSSALDSLMEAERVAVEEVAAVEAEIASVPIRVEAAVEAGDEEALMRIEAGRLLLDRRLERAVDDLREARLAVVKERLGDLDAEYKRESALVAEYELAADAYAHAVKSLRSRLGSLNSRWTQLLSQRMQLEQR